MSLAVVYSRGLSGLDAPLVRVEAHVGGGLPAFAIVGLPETEVKEARDRVRAALNTARFKFPSGRVTVSLAPADLPKESGRFDLPIALGILVATGQVRAERLHDHEFAGELALSGELRPIRGALAISLGALRDGRCFVLPSAAAPEAALAIGASIRPARTLQEVCAHLTGESQLPLYSRGPADGPSPCYPDLSEVRGQAHAKRALEIAAAGGHSALLCGPPGTGKTMLALRFPGILPAMTDDEALEAATVQSLASGGFRPEQFAQRAFRGPHHTASAVALVGGGSPPRPGEISLAHHGVLFLDELPEFDRRVLEVMREPMESGVITISRAARQADFPARFQLVAAMNPCPCGYLGVENRCACTPNQVARYRERISGPLLDRIDLHVAVPALRDHEIDAAPASERSDAVRARVSAARARQLERQGKTNSRLSGSEIDLRCATSADGRALLRGAVKRLGLSARAFHRVLKVARTIADLEAAAAVAPAHVAEALQYRPPACARG